MSLVPFLLVAALGAAALLLARGIPRARAVGGPVVLLAALGAALTIVPGQAVVLGEAGFATTDYLRLFLVLGSVVGLGLVIVGAAGAGHPDAPAVTLGILASSALALAFPDARLAFIAATVGGTFSVLLTVGAGGGRLAATAGVRVLRATVIAGTLAIAASAWIGRDLSELVAQPVVFGLAYLAVALAVAIRFGAIPFHTWAARLTDSIDETGLPLVTAWSAAAFAIAALAWIDASIQPLTIRDPSVGALVDLGMVRLVVLLVAIVSIVLASVAAWIQDDLERIVGYSIVGDAGVVLLAVAALESDSWAPGRTWILAFVVGRSAFAAWAAAVRASFGTGRVSELSGWAFRSPLLAAGFAAVVLASIGIPGLAAFDARRSLVDLALGSPLSGLVLLGTLTPLAYYGRLAVIGAARRRTRSSAEDWSWRPAIEAVDLNDLRAWAAKTWSSNRGFAASATAGLLAVLAVAIMAGAFGVREAAAGLPPRLEGALESFRPQEPLESTGPSPGTSGAPSPEPSLGAEPSSGSPTLAPVATP
jgi:formate hydrogenlyase subunit 3/multisubunit Na+/H+ antiporter MnhD subunit